ncbi:transcription initiation factor [Cordyceps fumosorosea ARSEF 2679]|uniref:Transcription initiation factor TFIID subunit 2 n=1 Tax=Cordyceps fumosorosea (strain ARSEF 2679) TaxID=1081104 RepID=A0A167V5X5_CORFA|nr:transcription initiation factor [Cordyceps fumosorosea ARSEF 2679]OAA62259.1 transcription initiation factor [Cordyceps fumosorosea ARSEF 2679]
MDSESERPFAQSGNDDLPPVDDLPVKEYFILKQEVSLTVDFRDRCIHGTTDVFLVTFNDKVEEVFLDAAQCEIDTNRITIAEMREVNGEAIEGQRRRAAAEYNDPYKKLSQPQGWNWRVEHYDLRRIRARGVFHTRKSDVPAENREFEGCTPAYGSLKVKLRGRDDRDRPRLIVRKSMSNLDAPDKSHKQYKITIPFVNRNPRDGLHFVGVDSLDSRFTHMYTRHSIQPGTASCIFPCVDDHGSRCDWRVSIKHPRTLGDALQQALATKKESNSLDRSFKLAEEDKLREMSVVCSGFLVEETTDPDDESMKIMTFEPEKKVSVQKLGFAVGPFEHIDLSSEFRTEEDEVKLGMSALKIHAYCLPGRGDWVRHTSAALTMAADFLTYTFARYPFSNFKLCFVDDLVDDTVSLHSLAFASNRLLYPEDVIDTEIEVTRQLVLTLTSQWIGINMIPNARSDLWLVVGMAYYMTDLFMKRICGNNEYRFRMKTMSDKLTELDVGRPSIFDLGANLHLDGGEMNFMTLKSPLVFFILDKRMNKASGGHGLTRVLQKLLTRAQIEGSDKSSILDTEKFKTLCEKGSRYRLETFWNQWVYGSGCPRFDVKARFNKKRLCVELTLSQVQLHKAKKPQLEKDDFLREIKERRAEVPLGDIQPLFTGPMTVRIHEADGTPYEHILEIREDATRATKFEIPYNTKYKRLKRTRRMKEKHVGQNLEIAENNDDALLYCLGDVLQSPEDQRDWELIDWDPETERKMDQESYEWIRLDADFEWASDMTRTLEPYMYVSQLQQDRDVVAQQDAMLYLAQGPLHPIASGFLVRTLVDRRYFHGIRTMAAAALTRQSNIKDIPLLGMRQLMRAFREMYCYENVNQPRPNDFTDKKQYNVRCAIIKAISEVRDHTNKCPMEARRFILDQLRLNNNEGNPYSDHFYIAFLVKSLSISLVPSKQDDWLTRQNRIPNEEENAFLEEALEQIERVLRRDEWTNSYQNTWTLAGLDAKQRLMKAEVIPKNFVDFGQYLLDGTRDLIRIKCFEALIDLGGMMDPTFFSFMMYSFMTDRSPYVRSKLIAALARGLAAIAFGEHTKATKVEPSAVDDGDGLLLVQDSAQEIEARKEMFARKENLDSALKALRKEMEETYAADERHFSTAMRRALDHPDLGRMEVENLLDLASMMFEEAQSWVLTLTLPKRWKAERPVQQLTNRLLVNFKSYYKIKPNVSLPAVVAAPIPAPILNGGADAKKLARTPSIKISTKPSISSLPRQSSKPPLVLDSITAISQPRANGSPASTPIPVAKRPRPDKEEHAPPAPKRPKTGIPGGAKGVWKKSRIVTLKTSNPKRLAVILGKSLSPSPAPAPVRTALPGSSRPESSAESTPLKIRKPLPSGDVVRRPLPTSNAASLQTPAPKPKISVSTGSTPAAVRAVSTPVAASVGAGRSPAPETPSSAVSSRPKIKIIRKPQPPPAA